MASIEISVIIVAHSREEYILSAVESVLQQTLPRGLYEVIVVKNFKNQKIDEYLKKEKVRSIYTQSSKVGSKFSEGILSANGDIICFLEDDDLFFPGKLKFVRDTFMANSQLVFLHNSFHTIDSRGTVQPNPYYLQLKNTVVISRLDKNERDISGILSQHAFHNISSISIRKMLIKGNGDEFREVSKIPDSFLFFQSLDSPWELMFTSELLTSFRVHQSLSHAKVSNVQEFSKWISGTNETLIREMAKTREVTCGSLTRDILQFYILEYKILMGLSSKGRNKLSLKEHSNYLSLSKKLGLTHGRRIYLAGILGKFLPVLVSIIYYFRYKNFMNPYSPELDPN